MLRVQHKDLLRLVNMRLKQASMLSIIWHCLHYMLFTSCIRWSFFQEEVEGTLDSEDIIILPGKAQSKWFRNCGCQMPSLSDGWNWKAKYGGDFCPV
eukprot:scaffold141422_cov19-Tisochrysis_lutea.AAC.1